MFMFDNSSDIITRAC